METPRSSWAGSLGYKAVNNKETLPQKKAKGKNKQLRLSSDLHVHTVMRTHLRAHTK